MSDHVPSGLKRAVAERAGFRCEYCLTPSRFSADPLSIEHVVPRAKEGPTELANLALACQGCNNAKYTATEAVDPVTGDTVAIYDPRQHVWSEHFAWNDNLTLILGITPIGRATVDKLRLNRVGVVNLRLVLTLARRRP